MNWRKLASYMVGRVIEHGERRDTRTGDQAGEPARLVAKGVEERVDDEVPVAACKPDELAPRGKGANVLLVRRPHDPALASRL